MLSDGDIRAALERSELHLLDTDRDRIQASSVDVTLDSKLLRLRPGPDNVIDVRREAHSVEYEINVQDGFLLNPHEFVLGSTREVLSLPSWLVARVEGKSSLGRLGLLVHCTAGFVDAGFVGQITLELFNAAGWPIRIYPGMPIAQLAFDSLDTPAENPYSGKYQGQRGPVASRYFLNWDRERNTW